MTYPRSREGKGHRPGAIPGVAGSPPARSSGELRAFRDDDVGPFHEPVDHIRSQGTSIGLDAGRANNRLIGFRLVTACFLTFLVLTVAS